ncbi:MAG: hypothetical protein P0Y48_09165 [Candidatus Microbacterium phytovorans]|uniref:Uncharacterized protein n=1 Tax=Candidatus Microbacterium phytovorans TaxID=3121374 RepID=A0AAJ5VYC0_9MICO|nr:hypothetical protein [Microbacterium sp.]WEK12641.1 MAG: hypothetical protein P0Y48_09165 [Microbacterium sp.]
MSDRIHLLIDALSADLSSAGIAVSIGVFDPRRGWVAGVQEATEPDGYADEDVVVVLPGREIAVGREGDNPDAGALAEAVCDWVMDESGHGWPERADDDGAFVALLRPKEIAGRLFWEGGETTVPIGQLSTVRVASPSSP